MIKFLSLKKISMKNIDNGINTFNKIIQNFGNSMDTMTKELSSDIEKSKQTSKIREQKDKENLEKIWGKRK
jgi:hypothetical protein